jgi:hypothetical protein
MERLDIRRAFKRSAAAAPRLANWAELADAQFWPIFSIQTSGVVVQLRCPAAAAAPCTELRTAAWVASMRLWQA